MEDDKQKLDTIRDDDHLERVVFYLNDLAIQFRDKGFRMPQYTESQNKRVLQDIELLLLTLMQFHTKILPIKYPKKLQYPHSDTFTMEVLDLVLRMVDKEEKK